MYPDNDPKKCPPHEIVPNNTVFFILRSRLEATVAAGMSME